MSVRAPFVRPAFATFFYCYAIVTTILGSLMILAFPVAFQKLIGPDLGLFLNTASGLMVLLAIAQGAATASIGYVIELIAKIEWNTRPSEGSTWASAPAGASPPTSPKRYFYIANGPMHGPLSAHEILALYRDGKVPNTARLYVEESGQRRQLNNWSEIGT